MPASLYDPCTCIKDYFCHVINQPMNINITLSDLRYSKYLHLNIGCVYQLYSVKNNVNIPF